MERKRVLITGATGYIAGHVILQFLQNGYEVVGTMRDPSVEKQKQQLEYYPVELRERLSFVKADLLDSQQQWEERLSSINGLGGVVHVASPFPSQSPKDEMEVILPAKQGTLNVARAVSKLGLSKLVVTSSIAAIYSGRYEGRFDEQDWGDINKCSTYEKSKIMAEQALWAEPKGKTEVVAINPGLVLGPGQNGAQSTSTGVVHRPMNNQVPGVPNVYFSLVDVRDVARAHLLAYEQKENHGQRYIVSNLEMSFYQIIKVLQNEFNSKGYKIKNRRVPKIVLQLASIFDKSLRTITPMVNRRFELINQKSKLELGLEYMPMEQTIKDTAYDLIQRGKVANRLPSL